MRVSEQGIDFIKSWTPLFTSPRIDPAGFLRIGYGHRNNEGLQAVTEPEATAILLKDIEDAEQILSDAIEREVTQCQFDAMCSLALNIDPARFIHSELLFKLNQGKCRSVPPQFDRYVFAGSSKDGLLVQRRAAERKLFETGDYGTT